MEKKINREIIRAGETDIKVHLIDSFPNHPYEGTAKITKLGRSDLCLYESLFSKSINIIIFGGIIIFCEIFAFPQSFLRLIQKIMRIYERFS